MIREMPSQYAAMLLIYAWGCQYCHFKYTSILCFRDFKYVATPTSAILSL